MHRLARLPERFPSRLGATPLARTRALFGLLALLALASVVARPPAIAAPEWSRSVAPLAGVLLLAHWATGIGRTRFPRALVVVEFTALVVLGVAHGTLVTLGAIWGGLFFRSLYGTRGDAALGGAALIGGILTTNLILADGALGPALARGELAAQLPNMAIDVVVMHALARALGRNAQLLASARHDAVTDALTGLGNRRALLEDLDAAVREPGGRHVLALFDLDGFKTYNDTFGHLAGDLLLTRLGHALQEAVRPAGCAYRLGGDEFCVLLALDEGASDSLLDLATQALRERGELFTIGSSQGRVALPREASTPADVLRIADERMYAHKRDGRRSAARQAKDALVRALAERTGDSVHAGALLPDIAHRTAVALGLDEVASQRVRQAAELHDVGKVAIPDAILDKPGPLSAAEWAYMKRHTTIGERIVAAAPDLLPVAGIVRASHEAFDGTGYPDGLRGEEIPLEARIVGVCAAYAAMTADRPHRGALSAGQALDELRRGCGTQFDPRVVAGFLGALADDEVREPPLLGAAA
jgi:two-component system, cell cycle response regulator